MRITHIQIENFRNFRRVDFPVGEHLAALTIAVQARGQVKATSTCPSPPYWSGRY